MSDGRSGPGSRAVTDGSSATSILPNLVGFAVARFVPAPFAVVSSIYLEGGMPMGLRVDAPIDVASRFVVFLAGYTISWVVTFAVVQRVRSLVGAWRAARRPAAAVTETA